MSTSPISHQSLVLKEAGSQHSDYTKMMTEGQANYLRLAWLVHDIATKAVRLMFDTRFFAMDLERFRPELMHLRQKRVISSSQWQILFPVKGKVSSEDMDLLLMLTVLRTISGICEPKTGWNSLPLGHDHSEGADLARIKYYRNVFVHYNASSVSDKELNRIWEDLSQTIIRIGGQRFATEISNLKELLKEPASEKKKDEVAKELLKKDIDVANEPFKDLESGQESDDIALSVKQGKQKARLEAWEAENKTFIPTRATEAVQLSIKENNLTLVSGPPGSGKSATVHHIALKMRSKGFKVVYVSSIENICEYWKPDEKQLFVLDDPFGIHYADEYEVKRWLKFHEDIKVYCQYSSMKILVSVRLHIIQNRKVKQVIHLYQSNTINITDQEISLTKHEKGSIFMKYASSLLNRHELDAAKNQIQERDVPCFPLLSKLYAEKFGLEYSIEDFFHKASDIIGYRIESLQLNSKYQYICLLYCMMCDSNLELYADDFDEKHKSRCDVISTLCSIEKGMDRSDIHSNLESLLGTYLKKQGNTYYFLHDLIQDAVIKHVNTLPLDHIGIIIRNCSSKFVREKVWLGSVESKDYNAYIVLGKELEDAWGERLLVDIAAGHWNDVLQNRCLATAKGDEIFAKSLSKRKLSDIEDIMCSDKKIEFPDNASDIELLDEDLYQQIIDHCSAYHWMILTGLEQAVRESSKCIDNKIKEKLNRDMDFLLAACIPGNMNMAKMFIEGGHNVNAKSINNLTPLLVASYYGHDDLLKMLVGNGASLQTYNNLHQSPLYISASRGHARVVNSLLVIEDTSSEKVMAQEIVNASLDYERLQDAIDPDDNYTASSSDEEEDTEETRIFLMNEREINECDIDGKSPLYIASENGYEDIVSLLLWNGADVNQCNNDGNSPALISSDKGHVSVLEMLINHGADVEKSNNGGMSPLHYASKNGNYEITRLLMDGGRNINQLNNQKRSALHFSAQEGHVRIVQMLLQNGAYVNQLDNNGVSPLYISSLHGHIEVVRMLFARGAQVNQCDKNGWSPLYVASYKGDEELVRVLLQIGADINQKNDLLRSPLFVSAYQGNANVVEVLVKHGAGVNSSDEHGKTPLYIAAQNDHEEIVMTLIKNGSDVNKTDRDGKSPIYIASQYGHYQIVKFLIEHGADIHSRNIEGKSPLYIASKCGQSQVLKLLIDQEADVNVCSHNGKSPLYVATENDHEEIVKILIENGCDVNKPDNNGRLPIEVAKMKRNINIMKLLIVPDKTCHSFKEMARVKQVKQAKHEDMGIFMEDKEDQLVHLLIQNFSLIVEEVDPESLMAQLCKEYPGMKKLFTLMESVRFRKPLCVRLLLEILVHYEECIPTVWDIIGKMYGHLKAEIKTRAKQSSHFITLGDHTCHKCSTQAFLEFLTRFPSIPENLLLEMLQNGKLKPEDFLEVNKCVSDEDKLKLFITLIKSHAISYLDFVAALLSVAVKTDQVITMMVRHLDFQLCDELKSAYNLSEMSLVEREDVSSSSIKKSKKKVESACPKFIAVVKLRTNKGVEIEKKLVETILQRKEKINSKIKKYGKIETAWLGSVVVVLKITSKSGKDIYFPHIYKSLKKMTQHLQEEDLDVKVIDLDDAGMTDKEKDLHRKKLTIMLNFEVFKTDLAIEIFRKEFSKRNIMDKAEFNTKFKVESCGRPQRTEIFLDFLLQSKDHVIEAFIDVLKTNEDHKLLSEKFNNALEYQNPVSEEYPSTESERTGASACAIGEQGNVANFQSRNTLRVTDQNLLKPVSNSCNNACMCAAGDSVGTHCPIRIEKIQNANIILYSSNETENNFTTVNEIRSKFSMHGEGNTSIVNLPNTENEDEENDTNDDEENDEGNQ